MDYNSLLWYLFIGVMMIVVLEESIIEYSQKKNNFLKGP